MMGFGRVGFIGVGVMGLPMATNLAKAGCELVVFSRRPEAARPLLSLGARTAADARAVAEGAETIITIVGNTSDVEEVYFGPSGIFAGVQEGALVIDMTTASPQIARKIAQEAEKRGVLAADAPVSGGEQGAIDGTLSVMAGGSEKALERAMPLLQVVGAQVVHVGAAGAGQVAKAANQVVVGLTVAAVAEALSLSERAGVDPARVRQALLGGFAQSRVLEVHGKRMLEGNFKPGFRLALHRKDLGIALSMSEDYGAFLPLTSLVWQMMNGQVARGDGQLDHAALVRAIETAPSGAPFHHALGEGAGAQT